MLLCVRERSVSDSHSHSSLQRQFSHGHNSPKFEDGASSAGTRVSHFLPTSRRIVQFSNGKVMQLLKVLFPQVLCIAYLCCFQLSYSGKLLRSLEVFISTSVLSVAR